MNSAYTCLAKKSSGTQQVVFEILWKATTFPSVLTTAWRALLDRIPTREGLYRRGVQVTSTECVLYRSKEESSKHLFIECVYAQRVWSICQRWLGTTLVQHNKIKNHFESFHCSQASVKQNQVWKGIWAAVVRCIWDQRNIILFKQGVVDVEEIFQMTQLKSWSWLKHRTRSFSYSFVDWISRHLYKEFEIIWNEWQRGMYKVQKQG